MLQFDRYDSWEQVRERAKTGKPLFYQAPLDAQPATVWPVRAYKNGKLRLRTDGRDPVTFTADSGHLERFRLLVAR